MKRQQPEAGIDFPDNPYTLRTRPAVPGESKSKDKDKDGNRKRDRRWHYQECPFIPSGAFRTEQPVDVEFEVIPNSWHSLNRYASFLLPNTKCTVGDFITVANDASIKRQRLIRASGGEDEFKPRPDATKEWVGRILDIRASNEHHVYARVLWLYHPDELPAGTITSTGKKIRGRQPYHGALELIASNHMDIIHAATVTSVAKVNHWIEKSEDDIQPSYYWRQMLNFNTFEISSAKSLCKCKMPANPDQVLVGCSQPSCGEWMHDRCLCHDALMRVYGRLGRNRPQAFGADTPSIAASEDAEDSKANVLLALPTYSEPPLDHFWTAPRAVSSKEPYNKLFKATLMLDEGAPVASKVEDLRSNVAGGSEAWLEPAYCLFCQEQME